MVYNNTKVLTQQIIVVKVVDSSISSKAYQEIGLPMVTALCDVRSWTSGAKLVCDFAFFRHLGG